MQAKPSTEIQIISAGIALTYLFYLTGTLYVFGSVVGWMVLFIFVLRSYVEGRSVTLSALPITLFIWIFGMGMMLVALLVAHAEFRLGTGQTIKSSIGWAKGWALLALFLFLGAILPIKTAIISRACCILASQTLLFVPVSIAGVVVGLDGPLYLSPLKAIGGPISTFEVNLFGMNPETGKPRWPFFAPWAPAAGLVSCLYLVICSQEKDKFWRRAGISGAVVMCLLCQSRAGWAVFLAIIPALYVYNRISLPAALLVLGTGLSMVIMLGQPVIEHVLDIHQQIKDARPDSTRVRNDLATIALQRWESEAPIWGHGIVEPGPKIVEFMPIGSHHSWYGLLFVKGIVGLVSFAIPMFFTFFYLMLFAGKCEKKWASLLILFVITCYSFFENIEILAYLLWPALIWVGITLNPTKDLENSHE